MSPYISHRVLLEFELIKEVKKNYKSQKVNKFLEEIYWRIYWKGWMENRPKVWYDYISEKDYEYDNETYKKAVKINNILQRFGGNNL